MEVWDFAPPADVLEGEIVEVGVEGDEEMVDVGDEMSGEAYGTGGSEEDSEDMTD